MSFYEHLMYWAVLMAAVMVVVDAVLYGIKLLRELRNKRIDSDWGRWDRK